MPLPDHDRLFRQSGKQILEQHSLLIRLVERFYDDVALRKQPLHVRRDHALSIGLVVQIRIDGLELLDERKRFRSHRRSFIV